MVLLSGAVSIQLMSPASGDKQKLEFWIDCGNVSIQLMSPASGDYLELLELGYVPVNNVSIQLMSPASGDVTFEGITDCLVIDVSIQLMSPASGDPSILNPYPAKCPETVSEGQEKKW